MQSILSLIGTQIMLIVIYKSIGWFRTTPMPRNKSLMTFRVDIASKWTSISLQLQGLHVVFAISIALE